MIMQRTIHKHRSKPSLPEQDAISAIPRVLADSTGTPTHVWIMKCEGYRPILGLNIFYLGNLLKKLEAAGKRDSKLWIVVDAEIKRQSEGVSVSGGEV
jgi:hypothetical protein